MGSWCVITVLYSTLLTILFHSAKFLDPYVPLLALNFSSGIQFLCFCCCTASATEMKERFLPSEVFYLTLRPHNLLPHNLVAGLVTMVRQTHMLQKFHQSLVCRFDHNKSAQKLQKLLQVPNRVLRLPQNDLNSIKQKPKVLSCRKYKSFNNTL